MLVPVWCVMSVNQSCRSVCLPNSIVPRFTAEESQAVSLLVTRMSVNKQSFIVQNVCIYNQSLLCISCIDKEKCNCLLFIVCNGCVTTAEITYI